MFLPKFYNLPTQLLSEQTFQPILRKNSKMSEGTGKRFLKSIRRKTTTPSHRLPVNKHGSVGQPVVKPRGKGKILAAARDLLSLPCRISILNKRVTAKVKEYRVKIRNRDHVSAPHHPILDSKYDDRPNFQATEAASTSHNSLDSNMVNEEASAPDAEDAHKQHRAVNTNPESFEPSIQPSDEYMTNHQQAPTTTDDETQIERTEAPAEESEIFDDLNGPGPSIGDPDPPRMQTQMPESTEQLGQRRNRVSFDEGQNRVSVVDRYLLSRAEERQILANVIAPGHLPVLEQEEELRQNSMLGAEQYEGVRQDPNQVLAQVREQHDRSIPTTPTTYPVTTQPLEQDRRRIAGEWNILQAETQPSIPIHDNGRSAAQPQPVSTNSGRTREARALTEANIYLLCQQQVTRTPRRPGPVATRGSTSTRSLSISTAPGTEQRRRPWVSRTDTAAPSGPTELSGQHPALTKLLQEAWTSHGRVYRLMAFAKPYHRSYGLEKASCNSRFVVVQCSFDSDQGKLMLGVCEVS